MYVDSSDDGPPVEHSNTAVVAVTAGMFALSAIVIALYLIRG